MHIALKIAAATITVALAVAGGTAAWHIRGKQPVRSGNVTVQQLKGPVSVAYDERGVPHIRAENEADLYRALGYVHAQDRLFQMEMVRRLAKGELAEILGPKLLETDKLFRTLGIRARADEMAAKLDPASTIGVALLAYLDGINQFQASHPAPLEFDVLKIPKRPFTPQDSFAVSGYLAYSFAQAFKAEPPLTYIRDKLGPNYLRVFDLDWHGEGVIDRTSTASTTRAAANKPLALDAKDWQGLNQLAQLSQDALDAAGVPAFEGSNAWAISGKRTASGKPLLAGDPHIAYSAPAVWYEAHLTAPGFDLYGHYQALNPVALLGHNSQFGWSLTMFENDDVDLIAERTNPANPNQVWFHDQWVDLQTRTETIKVKGEADVRLSLRRSPHGPIITDAFKENFGSTPIAMWWAFLETENPVLEAFYDLNRADTRDKARAAAQKIHSPGLNIVWANAAGDIAWWAAAKLPIRPEGVNPAFILDGSTAQADKLGFYNFNFNPQEENPARGYIVSANHQPQPASGVPVPGYYCLADRAQRLDDTLRDPERKWDTTAAQALQLDSGNGYGPRVLKDLLPILKGVTTDPYEKAFIEPLALWDGDYGRGSMAALLFTQLMYEIAHAAMADELGEVQFKNLLRTFALDTALPRLVADANSPWWDNVTTKPVEHRFETVRIAWVNTLKQLEAVYGKDLLQWTWGNSHTLTHVHPLGMQQPLDRIFNIGPFHVPGGRETPNNLNYALGSAPWSVKSGPSTRRVIDFARPDQSVGINPVGQSGVLFDKHYSDQAPYFAEGIYMRQLLSAADVKAHTQSTLTLRP
ncbi:MAG: penicillin acylase family protein [Burkholderiales bacterium]|nr:penicillin acylase family protein [Burkholderiales bacterium]